MKWYKNQKHDICSLHKNQRKEINLKKNVSLYKNSIIKLNKIFGLFFLHVGISLAFMIMTKYFILLIWLNPFIWKRFIFWIKDIKRTSKKYLKFDLNQKKDWNEGSSYKDTWIYHMVMKKYMRSLFFPSEWKGKILAKVNLRDKPVEPNKEWTLIASYKDQYIVKRKEILNKKIKHAFFIISLWQTFLIYDLLLILLTTFVLLIIRKRADFRMIIFLLTWLTMLFAFSFKTPQLIITKLFSNIQEYYDLSLEMIDDKTWFQYLECNRKKYYKKYFIPMIKKLKK
ncbi:hypothetical protein [Mycoplasma sp. Z473B]|uniref:hypothetical protein n=1 Tax=Mycoplasma sp. Z473B TaxID=3401667 RepID=UPI003AAF3852